MAVIIFEVVNSPLCIISGVFFLIPERASLSSTSISSSIAIDSEFEAFGVNIVREVLESIRELPFIDHYMSIL